MLTAAHEFCSVLGANAAVFVDAEGLGTWASCGLVVVGSASGLFEMRGNAVGAEVDTLRTAFAEAVRTSAMACIADLSKIIHYFSTSPLFSPVVLQTSTSPTTHKHVSFYSLRMLVSRGLLLSKGEGIEMMDTEPILNPGIPTNNQPVHPILTLTFVFLQVGVIAGQAAVLASNQWAIYCFWDFGLLYAYSNDRYEVHSGSIFHLKDTYCDANHTVDVSAHCNLFCACAWMLGIYGYIALLLGIFTILATLPVLLFHIKVLISTCFGWKYVHWMGLIPMKIWLLTLVLYYCGTLSTHMDEFKRTETGYEPHSSIGWPLYAGIGLLLGQGLLFLYVLFVTRKAFK